MTTQTQLQESELRVEFYDDWNCHHSLSIEQASEELRNLYNAWPGGLEEIESSINHLKHLANIQPKDSYVRAFWRGFIDGLSLGALRRALKYRKESK